VVRWSEPSTNPGSVTGYQVSMGDVSKTVTAADRSASFTGLLGGQDYGFKVVAFGPAGFLSPAASVAVRGTVTTLKVTKAAGKTKLTGLLKAGQQGLAAKKLKVLALKGGKWVGVGKTKTGKGGKFTVSFASTNKRKYRVVFAGASGLMGSLSPKRHL
jgi:hypothetical protein